MTALLALQDRIRIACVPGVVPLRIIVPEGGNWNHLGWPLGKPPVPVIYLSTPGSNRKAVLGLIDSEKNKSAVAHSLQNFAPSRFSC